MRGFLLGCALVSFAGCYPELASAPSDSRLRTVQVVEVCSTPSSSQTTLIGKIEAGQENLLYFEVAGTVAEVFVQEGDEVRTGDPIARLVLDDFELSVALAQAELEAAQARLGLLEAGTRREDLEVAHAAADAARHRANYWTNELGRQKVLFEVNAVTDEELEKTQREQFTALQEQRLTQAQLERAIAGPRNEELQAATAEVEARRQALALSKRQLWKATLRAPFDGRIEQRLLDVGSYVNVFPMGGVPVAQLVDLQHVDAVIAVPEIFLTHFVERAPVTVLSATDRRVTAQGHVLAVGQSADRQSGTYSVRVRIPNPRRHLKSGMVIETRINSRDARSAIHVPLNAVFRGYGQSPHVLIVNTSDNRVTARSVEIGETNAEQIEITSGLNGGEWLIVRGQHRVVEGDVVQPQRLGSPSGTIFKKPLP